MEEFPKLRVCFLHNVGMYRTFGVYRVTVTMQNIHIYIHMYMYIYVDRKLKRKGELVSCTHGSLHVRPS